MIATLSLIISMLAIVMALWFIMLQWHHSPVSYQDVTPRVIPAPLPVTPAIRWVNGRAPLPASAAHHLHLITQWYTDTDSKRQAEIDYCILSHLSAPFDRITVVVSAGQHFPWSDPRFHVVISPNPRPTFGELFQLANPDHNSVTVVANSDIIFDKSCNRFRRLPVSHAIALARWNVHQFSGVNTDLSDCSLQHDPFGSQDVWAVRGPIPEALTRIPFAPGVIGCDHALGYRLMQAGYELFNPALTIKTYHVHTIDTRQAINKQPVAEPGVYIPVCSW